MCGIVGIVGNGPEDIETTVNSLCMVNNRGQEAVGITATNRKSLFPFRHTGLVRHACNDDRRTWRRFTETCLEQGCHIFLGHTRYSTVGPSSMDLIQPIPMNSPVWGDFAVAHNGQISNHLQLRKQCQQRGHRFRTTSDTETLAVYMAQSDCKTLPEAVAHVLENIVGTYSLMILSPDWLIATRDRLGNRPLWFEADANYIAFASEVAALPQGDNLAREVHPGSLIAVNLKDYSFSERQVVEPFCHHCILEQLYFSRPDQVHCNEQSSSFRHRMGSRLAHEHPVEADIVCPVPDSGNDAAQGFAEASGIQFAPRGAIRNHFSFSSRSFILPGQKQRRGGAMLKYSVSSSVRGKRIVFVDDSLIRGNTAEILTAKAYKAGATEVHWRIAASPVIHPCSGGIDIPTDTELVASSVGIDKFRQKIRASSLEYLPYEAMMAEANHNCTGWCAGCFDGNYPYPLS